MLFPILDLDFSFPEKRDLSCMHACMHGIYETALVDDNLFSDAECESRGKTIISQQKDPSLQVEMIVPFSVQYADKPYVQIGDRIPLTIPAENITAQNFDVMSVEHIWSVPCTTTFTATSSERQKEKPLTTPLDVIHRLERNMEYFSRKLNR